MKAATPPAAVKSPMPLSLSWRGHRGDRDHHAECDYGRTYGPFDRSAHQTILPLVGPHRRVLSLNTVVTEKGLGVPSRAAQEIDHAGEVVAAVAGRDEKGVELRRFGTERG
jgi:hypothetical protein